MNRETGLRASSDEHILYHLKKQRIHYRTTEFELSSYFMYLTIHLYICDVI